MGAEVLKGLFEKFVLIFFPVGSSFIFDDGEQLVLEEGYIFVMKEIADDFPVFLVLLVIDEFIRFQHFEMNKTYNKPNI